MNIILISTPPNSVISYITSLQLHNSCVVDCSDFSNIKTNIERAISDFIPDIIITYRCPYILPRKFFELPRMGAYNIHPSMLPKYPGLNPWEQIFRANERQSGVTIHRITDIADSGEIILQRTFSIEDFDTITTARYKADQIAVDLIKILLTDKLQ